MPFQHRDVKLRKYQSKQRSPSVLNPVLVAERAMRLPSSTHLLRELVAKLIPSYTLLRGERVFRTWTLWFHFFLFILTMVTGQDDQDLELVDIDTK